MLLCHNPYDQPQPQENSEDSAIMTPLFVCHYNNIHSSAAVGSAEQIRAHFFYPRLARLGKATEEGHSGEGEIRESGHFHIEPIPLNYWTILL